MHNPVLVQIGNAWDDLLKDTFDVLRLQNDLVLPFEHEILQVDGTVFKRKKQQILQMKHIMEPHDIWMI